MAGAGVVGVGNRGGTGNATRSLQIRKRVQTRLADVKRARRARRERAAAAERAYAAFLPSVATPVVNAVAQSLSAEGYPYRVTTPGDAVRMVSDRSAARISSCGSTRPARRRSSVRGLGASAAAASSPTSTRSRRAGDRHAHRQRPRGGPAGVVAELIER